MSEQVTQEMPAVGNGAVPGSLADRMKRRGQELENQRSEVFEIPGWEDIVAVELRMMGYEESRKIGKALERIRSEPLRELYSYVDQIIAATVGFFEVDGDDRRPVERTWVQLAREGVQHKLPENLTPRQAVIAFVGDRRVPTLMSAWEAWMQGESRDRDEELVRDFGTTG